MEETLASNRAPIVYGFGAAVCGAIVWIAIDSLNSASARPVAAMSLVVIFGYYCAARSLALKRKSAGAVVALLLTVVGVVELIYCSLILFFMWLAVIWRALGGHGVSPFM